MGLSAARRSEVDDWFQMLESDRPRPSPAPSAVICPSAGLRSGRTPVRAWSGQYGATWWQPGQRQEDLWFPLLRRRPSLPFIPSVEAVKQPVSSARLGYANRSSVERLLQPAFNQRDDWYQYFNPSFTIKQQETRPSSSLASSITSSLAQARSEDVKGGVVRDSEFIERWQEALGLVDELREMEDLEHRLRGVRDLEDRLQEVDELAERIQEVIEEELGREEVEKMAQEEEVQPERSHVEMELAETLEVGEVDELEDEIKRVFFGEREVEERFKSGSLDDDVHVVVSQRKVRKTVTVVQESWQEQAETESASVSVEQETQGLKIERDIRTTSVFEEKGFKVLLQEDGFNIPLQEEGFNRHLEEEGFNRHLEEEGFNRHLEEEGFNIPPQEEGFNIPLKEEGFNRHLEEEGFNRHLEEEGFNIPPQEEGVNITPQEEGFNRHLEEEGFNIPLKEEGFNRHLEEEGFNMPPQEEGFNIPPQKEGFNIPPQESQVEDNDVWFRLFDRLPYKAVSKPQAASTVPAEEYFTSKSITTKVLEMKTRGPQVLVDELSPAGPQVLVDELSPAGTQVLVDELSPAGTQVLVDEMSTRAPQVLVDEMSTRGAEVSGGWEDVWFILLDVIPRGTPFVPPVTSVASDQEPAKQSYSSEMIQSPAVEDEREVMVEEERLAPEETRGSPDILEVLERVADDWFVLFQVTPRKTTYVSPVAADEVSVREIPTTTAMTLIEKTTTDEREEITGAIVQKIEMENMFKYGTETQPALLLKDGEDDWFVLLDVGSRAPSAVPPGSPVFLPVALKDLSRRVTTVAAVETIESVDRVRWTSSPVVTVEEVLQKQEERPPRQSIPEQAVPTREPDDWFVLLDVVPREVTYIAPAAPSTLYPEVSVTLQIVTEKAELTPQLEDIPRKRGTQLEDIPRKWGTQLEDILQLSAQPPPERDDSWFVLFDAVLIQPVTSPLVSSQSSGVEGRTTGTWQKVIIVEERRREETSLSDVQVTRYPSERKGGDEWFSLFDASRVSPVTRVAEVQGPMAGTALRGPSQEERAVVMEKKTVVMEERVVVMEERRPQEPTVSESEYGVVWHMLFQRVGEASRKMPTVERVRVSPKERASEGVPAVEQIPSRGSAVRQIWQQEAVPQPGNEVEDDWFVLLDVAPRKPVATAPQVRFYPDVRPATKATLGPAVPALRPLTPAVTALRPLAPAVPAVRPLTPAVPALRPRFSILAERLPAAQLREAVDDWFVLLDAVRTESVAAVGSHRGVRPVSAPVFSQAALAEAGLPLFPLDLPQTSTPLRSARQEERRLEVTMEAAEPAKGEAGAEDKSEEATSEPVRLRKRRAKRIEGDSIYIRHSLLMLEELEKPQEELLRHHASVSELKRNFMQAVPDSRPSEWDKRLSTHSPFRTAGANGGPGTDGITSDGSDGDKDSSTTFSSESGVTTTTTHISKVVKSGSTETRVEKRIVISAESEVEEGNDGTSM
ncbi:uncharacterized protein LOC132460209 isoform X15 [Gadus macrocephalus]|uniref:uncharacterized protein LOC132460209 isoform X15 n=1 Tax=Gadus macrocephalus TaxID=80720 RepID=UPI0028CB80C7|nr:uncharacterized protein LOC132460209 isoform X15 [Gadus macrocephalus]